MKIKYVIQNRAKGKGIYLYVVWSGGSVGAGVNTPILRLRAAVRKTVYILRPFEWVTAKYTGSDWTLGRFMVEVSLIFLSIGVKIEEKKLTKVDL